MIEVRVQVLINRPAGYVFDYISDFENNPNWQSGMVAARFTSPPPLAVGSTDEQRARFLGRDVLSTFRVEAYEPGRMVRASSTGGSFPITFTRVVEPQDSGCLVRAIIKGEAGGFFKLAEPLLKMMVQRSIRGDYENLKKLLD